MTNPVDTLKALAKRWGEPEVSGPTTEDVRTVLTAALQPDNKGDQP